MFWLNFSTLLVLVGTFRNTGPRDSNLGGITNLLATLAASMNVDLRQSHCWSCVDPPGRCHDLKLSILSAASLLRANDSPSLVVVALCLRIDDEN